MAKYPRLRASGLSWLLFLGILGSAPFILAGLIGVAYHPNASGAPMAEFRAMAVIVFTGLSLALAIRHTITAPNLSGRRIATELSILIASIFAVEIYGRATQHLPDTYLRYVGDVPYAFPRVYSGSGGREPAPDSRLAASYCLSSSKGRYDGACVQEKGLPRTVVTSLSPLPITNRFDASATLSNFGFTFTNDKIHLLGENDKITLIHADGLNGFSFSSDANYYYLVDESDQLVVHVRCSRSSKYCTVTTKTEHGNLSFPSVGDSSLDLARWRKDEKRHMALFDSWRCNEPRCGDRFTE